MASINGYELKKINWFKEHEGLDAFQAEIWKDHEKIGFFSESYMNGDDEYTFYDNRNYEKEIHALKATGLKYFKAINEDIGLYEKNYSDDCLIRCLRVLSETQKTFQKRNLEFIIVQAKHPYDTIELKKSDNSSFYPQEDIKNLLNENGGIVLKKLEDFTIKTDNISKDNVRDKIVTTQSRDDR